MFYIKYHLCSCGTQTNTHNICVICFDHIFIAFLNAMVGHIESLCVYIY